MADTVLAILGAGLVDPSTPVARADDLGLTRGDGCFEGCRVQTDADGTSVIDNFDAHVARMARSARALEIPFDAGAWRELAAMAAGAWTTPGEASMKLVLTRGPFGADRPTGFVTLGPLPGPVPALRRAGLRVITLCRGFAADAFADAPWLLGGVKTLAYAVNMAAQREAVRRGADDCIFVSTDGIVLESPTSSVVWAVGRTLRTTPPGATGILAGTTQAMLFERAAAAGWRTEELRADAAELHAADVVWLVGSVRGPVDIVELDGRRRKRRPDVDTEIRRLAGYPSAG